MNSKIKSLSSGEVDESSNSPESRELILKSYEWLANRL